jgi:AbrB family looped-hinge helix DNA binding protein
MPKSTITSKGQTTVPRQVRQQLGVGPGDILQWETVGSSIRVTVAGRAFLGHRGSVEVGPGDVVGDVKKARRRRGEES